jgi:hypothetical protein
MRCRTVAAALAAVCVITAPDAEATPVTYSLYGSVASAGASVAVSGLLMLDDTPAFAPLTNPPINGGGTYSYTVTAFELGFGDQTFVGNSGQVRFTYQNLLSPGGGIFTDWFSRSDYFLVGTLDAAPFFWGGWMPAFCSGPCTAGGPFLSTTADHARPADYLMMSGETWGSRLADGSYAGGTLYGVKVPEPGTLLMVAAGVGALCVTRRRPS